MIGDKELRKIRKFLKGSVNPLYFFDDDPDGLTSFLLLKKKYGEGEGVCVKASPLSEKIYLRKINEHNPDLVVILDRPLLSQEIIDKINVPIVWIDHHPPVDRKGVNYYNPLLNDKNDNRPTSYWAYRVVKENEWIAVMGIIGDWFVPEKKILDKFKFKDLIKGAKTAPEYLFDTPYGKLIKILSFAMKGTTSSTKECINALLKIKSPLEILDASTKDGKIVYEKYVKVNKEYDELLEEAHSQKESDKVFVFTYSGKYNSHTGGLSNELLHRLKNEVIIIGREKDGQMRMSIRSKGKNISKILKGALEQVEGYGGGHAKACGAAVSIDDFSKFIRIIKNEYGKSK